MESDKAPRNLKNSDEIRIVLIGKTGVGKSASANTILGEEKFESDLSSSSVTTDCEKARKCVSGRTIAIIDTPGLFDTKEKDTDTECKIKLCIYLSVPGPHVFLVVLQLGRFTVEEKNTVERIQKIFGEKASKYTVVLFTHGDKLKKKTIHQFVRESKDLHQFIMTTSGRYHVFNNKLKDPNQVNMLFELLDQLIIANGDEYYTNEMLQEAERAIEEEKRRLLEEERLNEQEARDKAERKRMKENLQLILVGLQGVGKSAAGNTILGREEFQSDISPTSLTIKSEKREADVCGRTVTVVDTPGLLNSDINVEEEMQRALSLCDPGPHAFLLVIQLGRFTEQERQVMDILQKIFCSNVNSFTIVLFTYGDKLKTSKNKSLDQFVKEDKNLQNLIKKCGSFYHVFNNTDSKNTSQVSKLFEIVDSQLKKRKEEDSHYVKKTNEDKNIWIEHWPYLAAVAVVIYVMYHFLKALTQRNVQPVYTPNWETVQRSFPNENKVYLTLAGVGLALIVLRKVMRFYRP